MTSTTYRQLTGTRPAARGGDPAPGRVRRGAMVPARPSWGAPPVRRDVARPGAGVGTAGEERSVGRVVRVGCRPPAIASAVPPSGPAVRLTLRGRRLLVAALVAVSAAAGAAALPVVLDVGADAGTSGGVQLAGTASVVVRAGDTLWSIAVELAPRQDPRGVVDEIQRLNHLGNGVLVPGQVLRVP